MENNILLYLKEIDRQIDFSFMAIDDIKNYSSDNKRVWYSIQSFLVSTANISKTLFGSNNKYIDKKSKKMIEERSKKLRNILKVDYTWEIKDVKIRNKFEHFDEKLDVFFKYNKNNGNFVDSNLGDINGIKIEGLDIKDYLRHYDLDKKIIYFMGEEYKVQGVLDELKKLKQRIKEITQNEFFL